VTGPDPRAEELAALLALDALEADEQADAELRYGTFASALELGVGMLAEVAVTEPPKDLRQRVLDRALARRPGGTPFGRPAPAMPIEAFARTVGDLRDLLGQLTEPEWELPAHRQHGRVRDVVAHLVAVEELVLAWVGARPPVDPEEAADHVAATRGAIDALADEPVAEVVERWYGLAGEVIDACRTAPADQAVIAHDLPTDVDGLLLLRTFELWAHAQDICAATGRPRPTLDASRLAVMSERLVAALPFALALRGSSIPGRSAQVVLTGTAGGSYVVPLHPGEAAGEPDTTIVTDVIDLCRVAARRLEPGGLDVTIDGDEELARLVLANVDAFARD
jgi:uncharacterized protein (TIGR03083 family)